MDQPNAHIAVLQRFAEPLDLDAVFASEPRQGRPRINAVCEDLFDGQLDVERAYWLGFIYADGSVAYKPYWAVTVTLASKDEGHVLALHTPSGRPCGENEGRSGSAPGPLEGVVPQPGRVRRRSPQVV